MINFFPRLLANVWLNQFIITYFLTEVVKYTLVTVKRQWQMHVSTYYISELRISEISQYISDRLLLSLIISIIMTKVIDFYFLKA